MIAVLAIIVLAGGAFVVYKLTHKRDTGQPAIIVAQQAKKAVIDGNTATITSLSTAQGKAQLEQLKPAELAGLKFGSCGLVGTAKVKTKLCIFTRPGGQLSIYMTLPGDKWKVNQAELGPAGLPPTTAAPTTPAT